MSNDPKPKVAVSYSWTEEREGQNAKAVNDFCVQLTTGGIEDIRDVDRVKHGDWLSSFMQNIGASDFLCVFLSDGYLCSPNCMYELLVAWQRSRDNAVEFRQRVRFWVMPGFAYVSELFGRDPYIDYWKEKSKQITALVKKQSTSGLSDASQKEHNTIRDIAQNVDAILAFVGDTLSPGTREEFEKWIQSGFPNAKQNGDSIDATDVYKNIVEFPADDEVVILGDGRQANLLHLVSSAVGDGMARLEKVFGKPAIDERRVPELPGVMKGIGQADRAYQTKLHFIRFVLGSEVNLDEHDQKKVDLKFLQTRQIISAAFEDDNDPFFGCGESFKPLTETIRKELQLEDFLLIHPDGEDPDRLMNANIRVLRLLGKIFDAVQARTIQ